jgi:hypothetical protein
MQYLITSWLLTALLSWTPQQGKSPERVAKLTSIATDIVDIVYHEPTTFRGDYAHAHMALLVGAVGARESRYQDRIQAGSCKKGECDSGRAFCYMQIHPNYGITILEDEREIVPDRSGLSGADLLADERVCIHLGVHMIRRALRFSGNRDLRAYIGETGEETPESDARFKLVKDYLAKNPPPVRDADFEFAPAGATDLQRE